MLLSALWEIVMMDFLHNRNNTSENLIYENNDLG
ncbi:Hypothetical protein Y17_0078 [Pectobacterium wasabiae CFBP 3304]|nr:Hypothetical protein Y17_0078 [Pectobacterium wasabiae CFBP 3304]